MIKCKTGLRNQNNFVIKTRCINKHYCCINLPIITLKKYCFKLCILNIPLSLCLGPFDVFQLTGPFHQPFQSSMPYASDHVLLIKNCRAPTLCTFKKVKVKICTRTRRGWRTFEFKKLQNSQKIVSGVRHVDLVRYVRLKRRVRARGSKRTDRTNPKIDMFKRY